MIVKLLEIKTRSYYFWDDTIKIEDFNPSLFKLDKKSPPVNIDIHYKGYISKKSLYHINSVNSLYLVIKSIDEYVEEIDGSDDRYLNISLVDSNNDVINKFNEIWKGIKDQILKINDSMELPSMELPSMELPSMELLSVKEYDKNYKKIRFNSDVALPLNTPIKFYALTVVIRCIIEKDNKYYPQIYLDDALFESNFIEL